MGRTGNAIVPAIILLALACYYTGLVCSGRIFHPYRSGRRWVYRSEQPALFWATTLQYAIGFATFLFLCYNDYFHNDNFVAKVTAVVIGFTLGGVTYLWGRKL